ncbi:MAG: T9SS C-terminal target domain-containing protein [Bacteroidetes bacterium]|nr:MAG: T9SS C-terminal target domain-containing protein [Bacteroidota bacterium]REK48059.1 MAG: T9SS C-terminal target domain-containing protein [Bacteroidota bacterium]
MDNAKQSIPGYFNLRAYGLVNLMLQNDIPVKWAIRSGKSKDGNDFSANARRILPSTQFPNWFDFRAGPFIVDSTYKTAARNLAISFGGSVAVYELTESINVDIRYTLDFKPRIAVCSNGGNQNIHSSILTEANMNNPAWVSIIPANQIVPMCGYTLVSEPHWNASNDTLHTFAVYRYLKNGGNFIAQCAGVRTYENDDTLHTTTGITSQSGSTLAYMNADMPVMQFENNLTNPGGSLQYWDRNSGGSFRSTTYTGIRTSSSPFYQFMNGSKVIPNNQRGGNLFYLGGHDYGGSNASGMINGRRIYLNTIFIPPSPNVYCITLPVNLISFYGKQSGHKISLYWATASEENNDYFILERSIDGVHFEEIAKVNGSGTVSTVSYYEAEDLTPLPGTSYYRLSQVDYDGRSEVFEPISIRNRKKSELVSIYPNPASKGVYVIGIPSCDRQSRAEIINSVSSTVHVSHSINADENGICYFSFPENLPEGLYTIRITSKEEVFMSKLVVRRN